MQWLMNSDYDAVFSVRSIPRLYNKDQQDVQNHENEHVCSIGKGET
jgi:hypothetical protein